MAAMVPEMINKNEIIYPHEVEKPLNTEAHF